MQNDDYQSALEMDDTEFYMLKSMMHLLRSILYGMNTYSFEGADPMSPFTGDYSWMEVGSPFLTIRDGAENYLPGVHADLNAIITSVQSAHQFVQNESCFPLG